MSRTILDVLAELGLVVELSSLEDTRGIFLSKKNVLLKRKPVDEFSIDLSGSVFYRCTVATDAFDGATLIDCSVGVGWRIPKKLSYICKTRDISLVGVDFLNSDLRGLDLRYAYLHGADLRGAILKKVDLRGADLRDANLQGADVDGCLFSYKHKKIIESFNTLGQPLFIGPKENLKGADLKGLDLTNEYLLDANLQDANLQGAILLGVTLKDADLQGANLQGADLKYAHLQGANLQGANLQGADLKYAKLEGANLQDADLRDADQRDADLRRASYSRYTLGLLEEHKSVMNYCWDDEDEY